TDASYSAGLARPSVFECPSDTLYAAYNDPQCRVALFTWIFYDRAQDDYFIGNFGASVGDITASGIALPGLTNYLGVAGAEGVTGTAYDLYAGVFNANSKLTMDGVTTADGTSNVLLFGETFGVGPPSQRQAVFAWAGCGALWTNWGLYNTPPAGSTPF